MYVHRRRLPRVQISGFMPYLLQSYPSLWTLISLIYSATLESHLHVPYCSVFIVSVSYHLVSLFLLDRDMHYILGEFKRANKIRFAVYVVGLVLKLQ
jgi:hypothetical protein